MSYKEVCWIRLVIVVGSYEHLFQGPHLGTGELPLPYTLWNHFVEQVSYR
jgi:hypothetical protein